VKSWLRRFLLAASTVAGVAAGIAACAGGPATTVGYWAVDVCGTTLYYAGQNTPTLAAAGLVPVAGGSRAAAGPRRSVIPRPGSWQGFGGPDVIVIYTDLWGCARAPVVIVQARPSGAARTLVAARGRHGGIAGLVLGIQEGRAVSLRVRAYLGDRLAGLQALSYQLRHTPQLGRYWAWCFIRWQPVLDHHPYQHVC
jgi:hypothetical protein